MDFERQWQMIMEDNMFAEEFTISSDAFSFAAKGVFYSGTQEEAPQAAYGIARFVNKEYLSVSLKSIPKDLTPKDDLKLCIVENSARGQFRVDDVSGGQSGTVTLSLQPLRKSRVR